MPRTKFNHLQISLNISPLFARMSISEIKEVLHKPVLLDIVSEKSGPKRFFAKFISSNQVEQLIENKECGCEFVINCASIDFLSVKINKTRILKNYPLFLQ